jgi:ABC-type transport system involved in cytochrome bd biosynthesis fused ATPase/permease subunit
MLSNLKLNNDSLLHWCLGPLVGWALFWFVVGIPIHFALGVRSSSIALFLAVQCALQIAVMPWLFAAGQRQAIRTAKQCGGRK